MYLRLLRVLDFMLLDRLNAIGCRLHEQTELAPPSTLITVRQCTIVTDRAKENE